MTAQLKTRARRFTLAASALASLTLLAACGGSPTAASAQGSGSGADVDAVIKKAESLTGQAQDDYLLSEAKKEGGPLRFYTSYSADSLDPVVKAFEDKYGIKVSAYRSDSQSLAQRISQETSANYAKGADFVEMRGQELFQMSQAGQIRGFSGDFDKDVMDYSKNGTWTADRLNVIVPCWNTDKVPTDQVPTSYAELTSSKWKGRLAIEQSDANWFETMVKYFESQGQTESQALQYFRDIVKNGKVVKGHTDMQNFIASGQYDLGIDCYTYVTEGQKKDGAPTDYEPSVSPAVIQPNGISIMASAKHPAAAALFYKWIMTDGQKILADTGNTTVTRTDVKGGVPLDIEGFTKDVDKWTNQYADILAGH